MSTDECDVIIVGARCAGASLATMLARRGVRVRVLEANSRGTGMAMSTHFLQPPAMDVLDRLGVGSSIRACTPASKKLRGAYDETEILAPLEQDRYAYCPRRSTLDPLLQEAAEAAGAEMLYQHTVREVLSEQGRVTGVVVETPNEAVKKPNFHTRHFGCVRFGDRISGIWRSCAKCAAISRPFASESVFGPL
jgi:flavin-dependent dehydrogenase